MTEESAIELGLLGELTVTRDGRAIRLPPSRKTRGLLAYLVLTGRPHRRERLCEMFWDVADDPRGALRWSLSKLRGLVNDGDRERIVADREHVRFEAEGCVIDALQLRDALRKASLQELSVDALEALAGRFRGELLEGLDLPDFDDYQAWCVAEREQVRKRRAELLGMLTRRLVDAPERALPHARAWVQVDPINLKARLALLRLSFAAGRPDEAAQHFESGKRLLQELGSDQLQPLLQAWRSLQGGRLTEVHISAVPAPPPPEPLASAPKASAPALPTRPAPEGLVGRAEEFAELQQLLASVGAEKRAFTVLVSGEPGIGKSRLVAELCASAAGGGATVLHGAAYEGEGDRPYGPWLDALRHFARSGACGADAVPDLEDAATAEGGRERLFAKVSDWVREVAGGGPLLIALDDVQWLDATSAELLHYVARNARDEPVLFALTARGEELPDNGSLSRVLRGMRRERAMRELALLALASGAIADLVTPMGHAESAARIFEQSGGNPLFALELARARARAADADSLPRSASDAVRDRIERLSPEALDVLRWGAVLGCAFSEARLQSLMALEVDAIIEALELLVRHALLRREDGAEGREGGYLFAHGLVRGVVYADLSQPRRELMHRRVAQTLQGSEALDGEVAAEIARHATLGQDHDLAASACLAAARRCLRLFAHDQANKLARRGLRHAESLPAAERVARSVDLHHVLVDTVRTDPEPLRAPLQALAEEALDLEQPEQARRAFYLLAFLEWEGGDFDIAREHTMASMVAARGIGGAERVHSMAENARCLLLLERDVPDAHAMLLEAQARARSLDMLPATLSDGLGMVSLHKGRLDEATDHFERALGEARAQRERLMEYHALEHLVMVQLEKGELDAVGRTAGEMLAIAERLPEGSEAPMARALGAIAERARPDGDAAAQDELDDALQALRDLDAKYRLAFCLCHAALLSLQESDPQNTRDLAEEALPLAQVLQRPSETLLALMLLASANEALQEPGRAAEYRATIDARNWGDAAVTVRRRHAKLLGAALPTGTYSAVESAAWR